MILAVALLAPLAGCDYSDAPQGRPCAPWPPSRSATRRPWWPPAAWCAVSTIRSITGSRTRPSTGWN
ncbi:hypothetical protein HML84_03875 [Alcanivorax sp. IO_7]|nr:hypothetical protein HML84_03875 [Alcanivorax sp. IO_7]